MAAAVNPITVNKNNALFYKDNDGQTFKIDIDGGAGLDVIYKGESLVDQNGEVDLSRFDRTYPVLAAPMPYGTPINDESYINIDVLMGYVNSTNYHIDVAFTSEERVPGLPQPAYEITFSHGDQTDPTTFNAFFAINNGTTNQNIKFIDNGVVQDLPIISTGVDGSKRLYMGQFGHWTKGNQFPQLLPFPGCMYFDVSLKLLDTRTGYLKNLLSINKTSIVNAINEIILDIRKMKHIQYATTHQSLSANVGDIVQIDETNEVNIDELKVGDIIEKTDKSITGMVDSIQEFEIISVPLDSAYSVLPPVKNVTGIDLSLYDGSAPSTNLTYTFDQGNGIKSLHINTNNSITITYDEGIGDIASTIRDTFGDWNNHNKSLFSFDIATKHITFTEEETIGAFDDDANVFALCANHDVILNVRTVAVGTGGGGTERPIITEVTLGDDGRYFIAGQGFEPGNITLENYSDQGNPIPVEYNHESLIITTQRPLIDPDGTCSLRVTNNGYGNSSDWQKQKVIDFITVEAVEYEDTVLSLMLDGDKSSLLTAYRIIQGQEIVDKINGIYSPAFGKTIITLPLTESEVGKTNSWWLSTKNDYNIGNTFSVSDFSTIKLMYSARQSYKDHVRIRSTETQVIDSEIALDRGNQFLGTNADGSEHILSSAAIYVTGPGFSGSKTGFGVPFTANELSAHQSIIDYVPTNKAVISTDGFYLFYNAGDWTEFIPTSIYNQSEFGNTNSHHNSNTNNDPTYGIHKTTDTPKGKEIDAYISDTLVPAPEFETAGKNGSTRQGISAVRLPFRYDEMQKRGIDGLAIFIPSRNIRRGRKNTSSHGLKKIEQLHKSCFMSFPWCPTIQPSDDMDHALKVTEVWYNMNTETWGAGTHFTSDVIRTFEKLELQKVMKIPYSSYSLDIREIFDSALKGSSIENAFYYMSKANRFPATNCDGRYPPNPNLKSAMTRIANHINLQNAGTAKEINIPLKAAWISNVKTNNSPSQCAISSYTLGEKASLVLKIRLVKNANGDPGDGSYKHVEARICHVER